MKTFGRFFIFTLILGQLLIAGCAKQPSILHIGAIFEVHGSPHIVQDDVCYYLGPWGPGAVVLKINYKGSSKLDNSSVPRYFYNGGDPYYEQITSIEWKYIDEGDLYFYVPLLIESLKDIEQGGTGKKALSKLYDIMHIEFPNGYGDYYMHPTKDKYTGTPFERDELNRYPKLDETTYKKWKQWVETEKLFLSRF